MCSRSARQRVNAPLQTHITGGDVEVSRNIPSSFPAEHQFCSRCIPSSNDKGFAALSVVVTSPFSRVSRRVVVRKPDKWCTVAPSSLQHSRLEIVPCFRSRRRSKVGATAAWMQRGVTFYSAHVLPPHDQIVSGLRAQCPLRGARQCGSTHYFVKLFTRSRGDSQMLLSCSLGTTFMKGFPQEDWCCQDDFKFNRSKGHAWL